MAEISAALVKKLREKTDAGMMDCKRALSETSGADEGAWLEAAADWLRTKGLSKAAKKADRVAAEGLIGVYSSGKEAAIVEVNSETDFVARNDKFQAAVAGIARVALEKKGDVAAIAAAPAPMGEGTVQDMLVNMVATIGENMSLRRAAYLAVSDGVVATYVHNKAAEGLGRIGVLVALESTGKADVLMDAGRKVAMHVASHDPSPMSVTTAELDPAAVNRERAVLTEQAKESGKPANVIEKMIEGRLRKFYQEVVLLEQAFVMDPDLTVGKFIDNLAKEAGAPAKVTGFVMFKIGEGIEKTTTDFAAEVASLSKP